MKISADLSLTELQRLMERPPMAATQDAYEAPAIGEEAPLPIPQSYEGGQILRFGPVHRVFA